MIFSSNFLPCLEYMTAILKVPEININISEQYHKQTYKNRAYIKGSHKIEVLNIPIQKIPNNSSIKDVKIDYSEQWQKKNWKSIETCYRKSPYFEYYDYLFLPLFQKKINFLVDYNTESLSKCLKALQVSKTICLNEYSYFEVENDLISFNAKKRCEFNDFFTSNEYLQIFGNKFEPNLSVIDLIFCKGTDSLSVLGVTQPSQTTKIKF